MLASRFAPTGALVVAIALGVCACGSSDDTVKGSGGGGSGPTSGNGGASATTTSTGGGAAGGGGGGGSGGGTAAICDSPIQPVDTSSPTTVVGSGAGTCTEQAFTDAVQKGGVITFDCGGPATIAITSQKELPKGKDTVVDGGGVITLDGGGKTRIFHFDGGDFRKTTTTITLQHLRIQNAKSSGTMLPSAPPPCSQGTDVDGGGAGILVRDGILHVIDVTFADDHAADTGPDVAGGGVYAIGSLDVTIVGSRFEGDTASNGGAVGSLFSNLTLVNDVFDHCQATGSGANYIDPQCKVNGGESGNGGNGGAVVMDGGEDFDVTICGSRFTNDAAGALGGGVFRTPDIGVAATHIDRSTFDHDTAAKGGGAMYFHHSDLTIVASTLSNDGAPGAGAIQADDTNLVMTNVTLTGNQATNGLGGAMALFGNGGTITNCTFADNHADGGSGLFGGAIAGNTALTIQNTIFADDTSKDCGAPMACADGQSQGSGDVQWPTAHIVCDSPDPACAPGTTFADPKLGALGDHGGPTETMVPAGDSPAAGIGKGCPPTDQRGQPRKNPDGCTAGAVELP